MPPLKAQLLLEESLSAYFPEMVFTDSGITVQLHRNTHIHQLGQCRRIRFIPDVPSLQPRQFGVGRARAGLSHFGESKIDAISQDSRQQQDFVLGRVAV